MFFCLHFGTLLGIIYLHYFNIVYMHYIKYLHIHVLWLMFFFMNLKYFCHSVIKATSLVNFGLKINSQNHINISKFLNSYFEHHCKGSEKLMLYWEHYSHLFKVLYSFTQRVSADILFVHSLQSGVSQPFSQANRNTTKEYWTHMILHPLLLRFC